MIKSLLKEHPWLMDVVAWIYNMLFSSCRISLLLGRIQAKGAFLKGTKVSISGKGNKVFVGRMARLKKCNIIIIGNGCVLDIGGVSSVIKETDFYEEDDMCVIKIGKHFTMEGGHIASTEGEKIIIGDDCMFSGDVEIRNGDSHVIVEKATHNRLNRAKPVVIGNHVWLTAHTRVLKGSFLANNCIVANSSVITGKCELPNCIYGGYPTRILKKDIDWSRFRDDKVGS